MKIDIMENSVVLDRIFVRTDAEYYIIRRLENVFSTYCLVTHNLCKRHFIENLRVNFQKKGRLHGYVLVIICLTKFPDFLRQN
jgi:hypothetical protein